MLEARKFTHDSAKAITAQVIFFAICILLPHVSAAPNGFYPARSEMPPVGQNSFQRLNQAILFNSKSIFDTILKFEEGSALVDPLPVSLTNSTTLVGSSFPVPVTVGDTTGKGIRSFQFDLLYDKDVIVPQANPIDSAGTISEGMGVSVNSSVPGVLRVVFFSSAHRTGAGTLFKFRFTALGADGAISPLTWQNFMFNEGDPAAAVTSGSVELVTNRTITVAQNANGSITPGTTVVPYGTNQSFTITPSPNFHIVDVVVDGASKGAVFSYSFTNVTANHTITATFAINTFPITATSGINGTVTPAGITNVAYGANQTYNITPSSNYLVEDVLVDGVSVGAVTNHTFLNVTQGHTISATFKLKRFALTVSKAGTGAGTVSSAPGGIDCGVDCTEVYDVGTVVTLTASPGSNTNFSGWSGGGCSGTGTCVVTLDSAKDVIATFALKKFSLNIVKAADGAGTVTSVPAGIDCGADCTESYDIGVTVTLTAAASTGSTFTGWSGPCSGTSTCVVSMTEATTVTATFVRQQFPLIVGKTGNGTGTVTSAPAGIDCGSDCVETYTFGTTVTLTATAGTNSEFQGWTGGGCSGTGTCVVTIAAATNVSAKFALQQYSFTVNRVGAGTGTVTSSPAGIDCGSDCFDLYEHGTVVTLTATPSANSNFTGWTGGACSGTGTCVVTVTAATTVNATFAIKTFALDVTLAGNGGGAVTSSPVGISCGADCTETYSFGTIVTLTAASNSNSNFAGWSGAGCSGTGTCVITMNAAAAVTATFALKTFTLDVAKAGTGQGTITSAPTGIDCGADCTEPFNVGTVVTLTATPAAGSTFDGWSGAGCTGTGTCVVTISAAATVTATFTRVVRTLTISKPGNGFGTVTSVPAGINCGGNCSADFQLGTQVTLTAASNVGSNFTGWSGGGCTGTGTCVVTIDAAKTVTASFVLQQFQLTVTKTGTGAAKGTVVSTPAGINCGVDCDEMFNFGNAVALTASATPGTTFIGWTGEGCSGTGTCVVTISKAVNVSAQFTIQRFVLSATKSSNGSGSITSQPAGINCGTDCFESYDIGTVVTLTATADVGSNFVGWTGACTGTGACVVTVSQTAAVNAVFTLQVYTLDVVKTGNGNGSVSSSPGGIACGPDCAESYNYGTTVTLSATANPNSNFAGWSGAGCSGTGSCVVPITQSAIVTANFTLKSFTLNVDKTSNGTGTITSSPAGIDCGGDCTQVYDIGTVVTLTASAGLGSSFAGWSGACSGTGTCVVTMNSATSVTAAFNNFPSVQFSSDSYVGNESRTAVVKVNRTGDLNIASSVTLSTSAGTANGASACGAGVDYIDISQPVSFAAAEGSKAVSIPLCPDLAIDGSETINLLLSSPVNANTGAQVTSVVTINDTANQYTAGADGIFLFSKTNAEPYPSVINVVNAPNGPARVRVTLYDVWHAEPENLYALLVSPAGTKYVLIGATGGTQPIVSGAPVTLTFGDSGNVGLPDSGPFQTGAFRPTTCAGPIPDFPSPAPPGPYLEPGCASESGPTLSGAFILQDLNGPWSLYVIDAGTGVPFTLAGALGTGWGLEIVPTNQAPVEISGQVLTPNNVGLRNAIVTLTDPQGNRRSVPSSSLGFFSFDQVQKGGPYTIAVVSRRYRFESRVMQIADNIQDMKFVGLE
jgi:hypothetical protein